MLVRYLSSAHSTPGVSEAILDDEETSQQIKGESIKRFASLQRNFQRKIFLKWTIAHFSTRRISCIWKFRHAATVATRFWETIRRNASCSSGHSGPKKPARYSANTGKGSLTRPITIGTKLSLSPTVFCRKGAARSLLNTSVDSRGSTRKTWEIYSGIYKTMTGANARARNQNLAFSFAKNPLS